MNKLTARREKNREIYLYCVSKNFFELLSHFLTLEKLFKNKVSNKGSINPNFNSLVLSVNATIAFVDLCLWI